MLLQLDNVQKYFNKKATVCEVDLIVKKGECVGLVGESGSGKTTLAKCILGLEEITSGQLLLEGRPLQRKRDRTERSRIQAVFQNPSASMNPRRKIIDTLMEPYDALKLKEISFLHNTTRIEKAKQLLEMVGVPADYLPKYPHQLSGGQKQRVMIAKAISTQPDLIVFDEPTASLDVTTQAKILNLLKDLKENLSMSYLFISHDLAAVRFMSERIYIMKEGRIIDEATKENLFLKELQPYTKQLISAFGDERSERLL
ncbi:nickel ABC transporter ATPase [Alkalihalobacillus alcalophilus ATCC 27647 = CGMCC 1.3604]|uniref:Nickel ABC transporter ATPase n=1 Tax=Alkalihalobacillus alcalophilus ATCC 27647 = CGMCC 1.3604 TaxID=1218173 RepID=A0A094XJV4_ALKAL|nr:dipeptide/oligopeptide/nickel ABC transporter ATP-binding protein [Alkalihalobacillus alcalophilus]KGA99060.1 peptide ABC transporter ATPase [Alkalihalobacillus alcalophilus ATCC 27647 = CGMCC 1.3604]MED1560705.1 dipeptide/oligopeptide/nickel ABC transporter ATP-binding protein [Alkalihalobacillus alcalophilus]THG88555.1 nickel ABC transporter ATPase [Alkalihalobacillus alcalophilus ATCC 27647 = CGMCC 1.3604]